MNPARDGSRGTKAYTSPRSFGGFQVPISLQSSVIRRYCDELGLTFHLHANENLISDSYLVLESVVDRASEYEGIAMCSVDMLPRRRSHRLEIVRRSISAGCRLHFVFERLIVATEGDVTELEDLRALGGLSAMTAQRATQLRELGAVLSSC